MLIKCVKEKKITNTGIRVRFRKILKVEEVLRNRQLLFLSRITQIDLELYPRILLISVSKYRRIRGRPFRVVRD